MLLRARIPYNELAFYRPLNGQLGVCLSFSVSERTVSMDSHSFQGMSVGGPGGDCCLIVDSFEKKIILNKRRVFVARDRVRQGNFDVLIILKTSKGGPT
jgi:hypothetical protein